jgi:hypothetical protein
MVGSPCDMRIFYEGLGFDTLPLPPNSKEARISNWQNRSPWRLWKNADPESNIALRAGGEVQAAFLDCDEKNHKGTYDNAVSWLATLGYLPGDYPIVATPSGGRHVYLCFMGSIPGSYRVLSNNFGAGEFRYGSGAYVAAPPSQVGGVEYSLLDGDYRQLPRIMVVDVLPLLQNQDLTPKKAEISIPRNALALLKGNGIERYSSRSEAEQACILSLINAGHDFPSVQSLFESHPCAGKYMELRRASPQNAFRWLRRCYDNALEYARTHESPARQFSQDAITWSESTPWPGRTGAVDRKVYIAHCLTAYKVGRFTYAASCRSLAELAGVSHETAAKSSCRLLEVGLLELFKRHTVDCANVYRLRTWSNPDTSLIPSVWKCQTLSMDVFRKGARKQGLGPSAREVYAELLDSGPLTVIELAERTGRSRRTVKRTLQRMSRITVDSLTGEIIQVVEKEGEKWHALEVDLETVARDVGTFGVGEKQKRQHERERRSHANQLLTLKKKE